MPIALTGYTALSVLRHTTERTPAAAAAWITLRLPMTFVRTACVGKNSQRRDLLQRRRVEDEVARPHGVRDAVEVTHVPEEQLAAARRQPTPHLVLLGLVAAEHVDCMDLLQEQPLHHGRTEGPGPAGDRDGRAVNDVALHV